MSVGTDGVVKLWDLARRVEVLSLRGHTTGVSSVAVSPDGHRIASGDWAGQLRLWEAIRE